MEQMEQHAEHDDQGAINSAPEQADAVAPNSSAITLDLDAIAADLADVEVALARLEAGTYFTDEVTGEPLPEAFLIANPTARTLIGAPAT